MRHLIVTSSLLAMLSAGCAEESDTTAESMSTSETRPNILLIIGDDMGFSDLGVYGSEVATPNIDALASEGLTFTNFHVGATCSPTRSLLMTGVDNHRSGLGNMHEFLTEEQTGQPGYEGYLNNNVVTISNLIRDAGYRTYMVGKWHLGNDEGYRPHDRGFDRTYSLLDGAADNYSSMSAGHVAGPTATFAANGTIVDAPSVFTRTSFMPTNLSASSIPSKMRQSRSLRIFRYKRRTGLIKPLVNISISTGTSTAPDGMPFADSELKN